MPENTNPIESQIESGESRGSEQQSLNDATFEPQSFVEQTSDYKQSEAVQQNFETLVGNTTATENTADIPATAKDEVSDGKSKGTAKDPLTGKGGESQSGSSGGESSDNPVMDQTAEDKTPVVEISDSKKVGHGPGTEVPPSEIDGNDPVYEMDTENPDPAGAVNEIPAQPVGNSSDIGPQRLGDDQLPEELKGPLGMGVRGSGNKKPGTVPKSGGGPPVGQHGSGSRGKGPATKNVTTGYTKDGEYFHSDHGGSSQDCGVTVSKTQDLINLHGKNHTAVVECTDGSTYFLSSKGNTFDGDQPMPYTGNWGGGEKPNPDEPQGGLDRESGKVFPVIPKGGGGGDTGGRTPGDKDGDDDSGKFLGNPDLGGGYWTNKDPGDLDYYTPDMLENALAKKQAR